MIHHVVLFRLTPTVQTDVPRVQRAVRAEAAELWRDLATWTVADLDLDTPIQGATVEHVRGTRREGARS